MRKNSVSVCLATYNGKKYIEQQINSILPQLNVSDELLISDDGSTDGTLEYILDLEEKNKIIRVIHGPQKGANANFFNLFQNAQNDIIFISDQDDIWMPNKIDNVCKKFDENSKISVVLHSDIIFYEKENREVHCNKLRHGFFVNLMKNSYSGHRMAFRKEFRNKFLKKTELCPAYDMYIGLLAEKYGCGYFLNEILDRHIMHGLNVTKRLNIKDKLLIRIRLLKCVLSK